MIDTLRTFYKMTYYSRKYTGHVTIQGFHILEILTLSVFKMNSTSYN